MPDRNNGLAKVNMTGRASTWEADAALIVHLRNHSEDYLAAVDALERLTEAGQDVTPTAGMPDPGQGDWARFSEAWHEASAALARLREQGAGDIDSLQADGAQEPYPQLVDGCPRCIYALDVHDDTMDPGCPDEVTARDAWGDDR